MKLFYIFISEVMFEFKLQNRISDFIAFNQVPMNFISLNSNSKFELNKSIGQKRKRHSSSPLTARRPISATTGNKVRQGVARVEAWTAGD
jgi:hypothetical protein